MSGTVTTWVGNQSCTPDASISVESEEDIVAAVRQARDAGRTIRTAGAGYSFLPVVNTAGVLLDTSALSCIVSIDPVAKTIAAGAQTVIRDVASHLQEAGLAPKNQSDINTQTLIGAVATATHGSGLEFGNFSGGLLACRLAKTQQRRKRL